MRKARKGAALACAVLTTLAVSASFAAAGSGTTQQVSQGDPFASCTAGTHSGHLYPGAEDEPMVSANPNNPGQVIGVFQQDRFSNGGSHGGGVVFSHDGQHFAETVLPFGVCATGVSTDYLRESDFWVTWGPDNVAYASALQVDVGGTTPSNRVGVGGATTFDGGATWRFAQPVIADNDPAFFDDKNSETADPVRAGSAYQVWDRLFQPLDVNGNATDFDGPAMISITRDHGKTWSAPAVMVNTRTIPFSQTIGNVIVADPRNGNLYDLYARVTFNDANNDVLLDSHYEVVSSTDGGVTWSAPKRVVNDSSVAEVDPNVPSQALRTGAGIPSPAIDPNTGELFMAYEGSDFSGGAVNQIELVHSSDGGATWSAPMLASGDPNAAAFTPSVTVTQTGELAITYYDTRHLLPGNTTTLPTSTFLRRSPASDPTAANEEQIAPDFDWLLAPVARGHFLGDYEGITADSPFGMRPLFVTTANAPADPTDVFSGIFHGPGVTPSPGGTAIPAGLAALMRGTHGAHKTDN